MWVEEGQQARYDYALMSYSHGHGKFIKTSKRDDRYKSTRQDKRHAEPLLSHALLPPSFLRLFSNTDNVNMPIM